jgi:hypothetical protein
LICAAAIMAMAGASQTALAADAANVGVVSHVKVVSDKVEDVSSLEAWKKSNITDSMTDTQKLIAIWKTVVKYRHQDDPANEDICSAGNVHDPMKTIHVYGYGMCCCASANVEGLARFLGYDARGYSITLHSIPEVYFGDAWHTVDGSLMNYFTKPDGNIPSAKEVLDAVAAWHKENPGYRGNDQKLREISANEGWKTKGPALLATNKYYGKDGVNSAGWHGWWSNMEEYDCPKAFATDWRTQLGYELNIQLRPGDRLTRNWFNKGLVVNGTNAGLIKGDRGALGLQKEFGDIAPGRIGNGTFEYDAPVGSPEFLLGCLQADNVVADNAGAPKLTLKDAANPGVVVVRMPCSYVYLNGTLKFDAVVGDGGKVVVSISENNGLDWTQLAGDVEKSGPVTADLKKKIFRHYDYQLKFELTGKGTGLNSLNITHDIQHSQAPLPALAQGDNTITFSAGPQEGTVTIEGQVEQPLTAKNGHQLTIGDFHPVLKSVDLAALRLKGGSGSATFNVDAPGDISRLRTYVNYRGRDPSDGWTQYVSYDKGENWKLVEKLPHARDGSDSGKYEIISDVPAGTKSAQVKFQGKQTNTCCMFDLGIYADYKQPNGGFRPVQITYVWEENGKEMKDVHVAKSPSETYKINCATAPLMKTIVLELAK